MTQNKLNICVMTFLQIYTILEASRGAGAQSVTRLVMGSIPTRGTAVFI